MLTKDDLGSGPLWLVIGTRRRGDRCCLASAAGREEAEAAAERFRRHLEGYTTINVELAGSKPTPPPAAA